MSGFLPTSFMHWQDKSFPSEELAFVLPETRSSAGNATEPAKLNTSSRTGFPTCSTTVFKPVIIARVPLSEVAPFV